VNKALLEHGPPIEHGQYKEIPVSFAGYPMTIERHADWLTTAYWTLPDEYTFDHFLTAVENTFKEAEGHGYEPEGDLQMAVGSPELDNIEIANYIRPLETDDFEELSITADQVSFLKLGNDLAHFTFNRPNRQVGLLFYEKPHQTRSAFRFMAEMLPPSVKLTPHELGEFVLALPR
jgi:hypothetical protein